MVELVALEGGRVGLVGGGRVIPAAEAVQLLETEQIRAAAQAEAEALVAAARAEADAIRESALAAGVAAATDEIQDRLFDIAERTVSAIARTENRIIDLALEIAARVIGTFDADEVTRRTARQALKLATHSRLARLLVAPSHVEAVRKSVDDVLSGALPTTAVEVVGDPRVRDGGCILETDAGLVDATIESQLAALTRGLHRSLSASAQQVES